MCKQQRHKLQHYAMGLGWLVFVDLNSNAAPNLGTGACLATEDCIIQVSGVLQGGNTLRSSGFATCRFRAIQHPWRPDIGRHLHAV